MKPVKNKQLKEITLQGNVSLLVKKELMHKIWLTNSLCFDREWSGTLFCSVTGNIGDKNFAIVAEDMFVQDVGTSGYTEFEASTDVIEYMMNNTHLLDLQRQKIHC